MKRREGIGVSIKINATMQRNGGKNSCGRKSDSSTISQSFKRIVLTLCSADVIFYSCLHGKWSPDIDCSGFTQERTGSDRTF